MDINTPVSSIMTTDLYTLNPADKLLRAKELFGTYPIHHLPVVTDGKVIGMLSKTDYLYFLHALDKESREPYLNEIRLKNYPVEEVMSKNVISVNPSDSIKLALEIFHENLFHAVPVVENGRLVGIVTTHDVIHDLLKEKKYLS